MCAFIIQFIGYDSATNMDQDVETVRKIPLTIGHWQGQDYPLESWVYDILETRAILHRNYTNDEGRSIFLSIVYYAETKVDFHRPEACLGGQGFKTRKSPLTIEVDYLKGKVNLNLNRLIRKDKGNNTLVYYFFKSGDFLGRSYIKLRLNLIFNKFKNANKSGSLIRISTPSTNNGKNEVNDSHLRLQQFINSLHPYLMKHL